MDSSDIRDFLGDRMELRVLPIEDVSEWENNARIHTRQNLDALKTSLGKFDQYKPIIVQKSSMRIIAGNGTYLAARSLGRKNILCNIIDISDEEAEALSIADNRTGLLSQWEESVLTENLKKIQEQGNLELTGFDSVDLEKMLSFQNGDLFEKITPNAGQNTPKPRKQEPPPPSDDTPPEEPNPAPREEPAEPAADYTEQIAFTIGGFVFALDKPDDIRELRCLVDILKDADTRDREDVNRRVFQSIIDILTEKFMR